MPVQRDGPMGTRRDASSTTITAAGINEGRLARIDLQDRLAATDIACLTFAACLALFIHDVRDGGYLGFSCLYHRHLALLLRAAIQACHTWRSRIPHGGIRPNYSTFDDSRQICCLHGSGLWIGKGQSLFPTTQLSHAAPCVQEKADRGREKKQAGDTGQGAKRVDLGPAIQGTKKRAKQDTEIE